MHTTDSVTLRQDATTVALVSLAHASSHFSQLMLPLLFPVFVHEFGFGFAQLGGLMSLFFALSGIGQAGAGFVVDRLGARPLMLLAMVLFVGACVSASTASGYAGLALAATLAGLGNATFHPVDFTILNQRVSAARLGYAYSAHGLSGNLGWAAAPVFFALLSAALGWRTAYLLAAGMYAGIFVLLWLMRSHLQTRVAAPEPVSGGVRREHAMAFMKLPVVWWCFAFFLLSTMTFSVVQSFAVPILEAMYRVSFQAATLTLTAYMLAGALGMLAGGMLAARVANSDRVVAAAMVAGAALLALCASAWLGATAAMVVLAATGFSVGVGGPSRDMMIRKATPRGATGRVYGLVYSGLDTGAALSPVLFGGLMDQGRHGATLLGAACILLLSVFVALGVGRRTAAPVPI